MLRPYPEPRPIDRFRRYTRSWTLPASVPGAPRFRSWSTDNPPPSHSIPANVAVKAAARQGAFEAYNLALMEAYFYFNRTVTDLGTIVDVASGCGLDLAAFTADVADPSLQQAVVNDHNTAVAQGVRGVPAMVVADGFCLSGAQDREAYLRFIARLLARVPASAEG